MTEVTITVDNKQLGDVKVSREDQFESIGGNTSVETITGLLAAAINQVCAAYGIDPTTVLD